jgi:hypothetical protein
MIWRNTTGTQLLFSILLCRDSSRSPRDSGRAAVLADLLTIKRGFDRLPEDTLSFLSVAARLRDKRDKRYN